MDLRIKLLDFFNIIRYINKGMTEEMITDNENLFLKERKMPVISDYDDHAYHIREHSKIKTVEALEHIKEHLYELSVQKKIFNGTYQEFWVTVTNYIWWWNRHERNQRNS